MQATAATRELRWSKHGMNVNNANGHYKDHKPADIILQIIFPATNFGTMQRIMGAVTDVAVAAGLMVM